MSKNVKTFGIIGLVAILVFAAIFGLTTVFNNAGKTDSQITREQTVEDLNKFVDKRVNLTIKDDPIKGVVDLESTSLEDELPEIDKYPYKVKGNGEIDIEIFSSPEKAGSETNNENKKPNTWLIKVVENFNNKGYKTSTGKTVSVSLRSVSSGVMVDYISSGKYIPDGITPSNEFWVSMLKSEGFSLSQEAKSLVQNVAGIVVSDKTYDKIVKSYGTVNIETVSEATINNEMAMGYTNPYASSAGLNFLVSCLYAFSPSDPLSKEAITAFEKFQANVPVVSYNTTQMEGAINSGALDGMIYEYQSFVNTPALKNNYKFIPYGVRHDNPLYSIGKLSAEKQEVFKLFAEFATNESQQNLAKEYGFGGHSKYTAEIPEPDGKILLNAQKLWKDKKDGGQEIISVFILDTSGSVAGAPLNQMKTSLINAAKYINPEHYVGLVSYNTNVTIHLPIAKFDLNQQAYFNGEIQNLTPGGGTFTFDAIAVGLKMLEDARVDHPNAKFMLFVLSDGRSNGSLKSVASYIETLDVPVYTIGYNATIEALQEISAINEAASINAETDDIVYSLKNLFNAEM